ncbi:MAG: hypothetical protein M0Z81_05475 [Deltaproteobacteria bacterium]|nr:hypothetical protein [Deltaproteobacteria bacterium]
MRKVSFDRTRTRVEDGRQAAIVCAITALSVISLVCRYEIVQPDVCKRE